MPQWPFRPDATAADPLLRTMQEQAADESLLMACFARRYEKDAPLSPLTYRSARAAIRVLYGIPEGRRPTIDRIGRLFAPRDELGAWMLAETGDREAAAVFLEAARLSARSPQQWEHLLGAGARLLDVLGSPAVWARDGRSLDWKDVIRGRKHYLLGMEGLPQTIATTLAILAYAPAIQAARELAEATGRPHPLVVVLEEAGALGLVTPVITLAMQAYRKYGVSVWIASQTVHDFRDAETFESVLAMSEHYWHQMASGVERAARDCAEPTYDPDRVIHARERPIVASYQEVATRTVRLGPSGRWAGETRGTALRPVLGVHVEEVYDNPANHEAEFRRKLSTLGVGERFFRGTDGTVRRETVPLPADPWGPFADEEIALGGVTRSLARHRLDAAHRRIRQSPIYQPPASWTTPPPHPSDPQQPAIPPTDAGREGMRGS